MVVGLDASRPTLAALDLSDPPDRWEALGFAVAGSGLDIGGVRLELGRPGRGITGWTLRHVHPVAEIDGLPTAVTETEDPQPPAPQSHANGAIAIDHVVVVSPDFDRTQTALEAAGISLSRTRDAGGFRQGFRRLGPAILELVEAADGEPGPARFWGLVVVVADVERLAARLGDRLGSVKHAVQPGRRIATLRSAFGLSVPLAFMDPEPRATLA